MDRRGVTSRPGWALHAVRALLLLDAAALRSGLSDPGERDGVVTLSGVVTDALGAAVEGVVVRVTGSTQAMAMTDSNGTYSLAVSNCAAETGSWSVHASLPGCELTPSSVDFTTLTDRTVLNFTASGAQCAGEALAADPGPRPGPPGAGGPALDDPGAAAQRAAACLRGLAPATMRMCAQAFVRFEEVDSVSGTVDGEPGAGLGPTFNGNGCAMCHAQPAILGSAPGPLSPQKPAPNPQVALATLDGAQNTLPPFVTADGPVRAPLFRSDGAVHDLFTIAGRSDARGCTQAQPDFAAHLATGNVGFRIPLALFGLGLVEAVSDAALQANLEASRSPALGIAGSFNRPSGGAGIGRFGWKAQNPSLLECAAEAYAVEIGVTNEMFPQERGAAAGCILNGIPEDVSAPDKVGSVSDTNSDVENFAMAIRLSAPPEPALPPGITQASIDRGRDRFAAVGCAHCHTPALTTATSNLDPKLSGIVIHPFSDFAVHHMGAGLADGIAQGTAGPDEFRSTPLWGVGQRLFFLHDGRTSNLVQAIEAHEGTGSEANAVIAHFKRLPVQAQQDIVNFLRSL